MFMTLIVWDEWLQNKGEILVRSEYYNQFGIYRPSRVSTILHGKSTYVIQRHIQNPVKYLRWSFLRK